VGLSLVAREFVAVVYGSKWLPSVPGLRILAVAGGLYCVAQITGPVLLAMGRPGLQTKILFGSSSVLLVGALLGVRLGIAGVALSVLAAVTVALALGQYFVIRTLEIRGREYRHAVAAPLEAIVVMAIVVLVWQWVGRSFLGAGDPVLLSVSILLGAVSMLTTLSVRGSSPLADIRSLLRGEPGARTSAPSAGGRARILVNTDEFDVSAARAER